MNNITELLEKITLNSFDVGCSYWVTVSHINNPHSFYVRPTAYRTFLKDVNVHGDLLHESEIQLQAVVVYDSKKLRNFVRGKIFSIDDSDGDLQCVVFALDFGIIEKGVPAKNLRKSKVGLQIPPLVTHCQLANCQAIDGTWTDKTIKAMKFYVGDERAKMVVREKSSASLVVDLFNTCPDDIATMLALTGYSTLGYGENVINRLTVPSAEKHFFTYQEINVGDVIKVRLQFGKSLDHFFVARVQNYRDFLEVRLNLTYFTKKLKQLCSEDLKEGLQVALFLDEERKYERGIVKKIPNPNGSKVIVQLIDWGKCVEVDISNLKPMSEKFFYSPALAIYCSLESDKSWDHKLFKYLYPGNEFVITVKKLGDKHDTPNIVEIS